MTTAIAERSRVTVGGLWALQIISAGMFLLAGITEAGRGIR